MSHNWKYYKKTLKRNAVMSRNRSSMLQSKVLRTNDSSNAVNQVLYNNLTSVAETNSSEKEIKNAEEQQESDSNDKKSETLQIFEILSSTENVNEPDFDISSSIDTAKELLLNKPRSFTTPDLKKSKESKLA